MPVNKESLCQRPPSDESNFAIVQLGIVVLRNGNGRHGQAFLDCLIQVLATHPVHGHKLPARRLHPLVRALVLPAHLGHRGGVLRQLELCPLDGIGIRCDSGIVSGSRNQSGL